MPRAFAFAVALLPAGQASAQETYELGTTTRGRLRDPTVVLRAGDAIEQAGVPCRVADAIQRGRDISGAVHYEVTCAGGPGYVVTSGPDSVAISCLDFAEGGRLDQGSNGCRLPRNRNPLPHFVRIARSAVVDCTVDGGRATGRGPRGYPMFEISCAGPEGYWVEQGDRELTVTDCLTVSAQGGACRLTSEAEQKAAFRARLRDTELDRCDLTDVRPMGVSANGSFHEVACRGTEAVVLRIGPSGSPPEVIPCAEARRIGGGCLARPDAGPSPL